MNIEFDSWFKGSYHHELTISSRFVTMYLALDLFLRKKSQVIVETGAIREEGNWLDGLSTLVFGSFCKKFNHCMHSVDMNPATMEVCRKVTSKYENFISYHVNDSVIFLKNFNQKIDLLYLDSRDCSERDAITSPYLIASQEHQLEEIEVAFNKLSDDPIILLDDNDFENGGKTRLSKVFLKANGFKEIMSWKQSLWVKK